ncbi:MAG: hypothetical protein JKX78_14385 [Alteromonadaceae bacterium]|nr:hypothetical protein [Alteromonadaceae bacterium]
MFKKLVPFIIILVVSSCTSLTNEGADVLLVETNTQLPKDCSFIKYIEASAAQDDLSSSFEVAKIRLRNEAGKENANYVVITKKGEGFFLGAGFVGGKAYRCKV